MATLKTYVLREHHEHSAKSWLVGVLSLLLATLLLGISPFLALGQVSSQIDGEEQTLAHDETSDASLDSAGLPVGDEEPVASLDGVPAADVPALDEELAPLSDEDEPSLSVASTNDPRSSEQWALESIGAYEAWELVDPSTVTIAQLDVGVDITHEDLAASIVATYNAYAASQGLVDTTDVSDASGHGTHVAGILAGVSNNSLGITGASGGSKLLPIKVVSNDGRAYTSALVAAMDYVISHALEYNIRVVNLSMGFVGNPDDYADNAFLQKIDEAYDAGIVTVSSAGNWTASATPPYDVYPGDYARVVNVISLAQGASEPERASDSNYNAPSETDKTISAPGVGILSTLPGNTYGYLSGTSMATPHVSAALALIFAANPDLSAQEAIDILYASARDLGESGFDAQTGYGEVNMVAAVRMALGIEDDVPVVPQDSPAQEEQGSTLETINRNNEIILVVAATPEPLPQTADTTPVFWPLFSVFGGLCLCLCAALICVHTRDFA